MMFFFCRDDSLIKGNKRLLKMKGVFYFLQFTWIPLGEVEVGEIDNVVSFLLLLVEESQFCRSAHNIVSYDTLIKRG